MHEFNIGSFKIHPRVEVDTQRQDYRSLKGIFC
jgi:hypothetical protein